MEHKKDSRIKVDPIIWRQGKAGLIKAKNKKVVLSLFNS